MKFKRMAVVAAAAVVGPSVLMATPAMADEVKSPAVTTPDAEPKGEAAVADEAYQGPKLSLDGLPADGLKAGGEWTELTLRMDNRGRPSAPGFNVGLMFWGPDRPITGAHIEVEQHAMGEWAAATREPGPSANTGVFTVLNGFPVARDKVDSIRIRVRVSADAPARDLGIHVMGTDNRSIDSETATYRTKITREQQAVQAPTVTLSGLPEMGFKAGDDAWRTLNLKVDNTGRPATGEFRLGIDLVRQAEAIRAGQVQVEYQATTTDGQTYWSPVEVAANGQDSLRIFNHGGQYAAGEKRELVLRMKFAQDTPQTGFALNVFGAGNPHQGGAAPEVSTYYSGVTSDAEVIAVEGPNVSVDGLPAGGFRAGADWQELQLHLDNTGKGALADFLVATHMGRAMGDGAWVTPSQIKLQAYGAEGWYDVEIDGSEEVTGGDIGLVSLKAGEKTTLKLRLRFTGDTAPGDFAMEFGGYAVTEKDEFISSSTRLTTKILAATAPDTGGNGGQTGGNAGNQPKPDGGPVKPVDQTGATTNGATTTTTTPTTTTAGSGGGQLAATGADPATAWALGGAGLAVAMGAAFVAGTGKRRRPTA